MPGSAQDHSHDHGGQHGDHGGTGDDSLVS